jgi:hypothetical protein
MVKCHHHCAEFTVCARKEVSGTKMINFDNCERSGEMRVEECTR